MLAASATAAAAGSPWDPKYTQMAQVRGCRDNSLALVDVNRACFTSYSFFMQALLNQMNLTEKLTMVRGWGGAYVGDVPANTRLNIPALTLEDGPQGRCKNSSFPANATSGSL